MPDDKSKAGGPWDHSRTRVLAWLVIRDAKRTSLAWERLLRACARRQVINVPGKPAPDL